MSIKCGSQVILCDLPIRFDTYEGCSHACRYCFVKKKNDITKVEVSNCITQLKNFIAGKKPREANWCDWDIPLHWGGMSDPFQPCEATYKISLECLKVFAETKYPFVVSTKGKLLATDEYLEVLKETNSVVQISMVCSKYDVLEKGAPTYEERLEMCRKIAPCTKRLIVRVQPYMPEIFNDLMKNLPRLKEAGVYGITIEGMKFMKTKPGLVKVGGDCCYPINILKRDFERIKAKCHELGLAFFCAENRLRAMGDGMCCCGIEGLEGFKGNDYNICHMMNGDSPCACSQMKELGTAEPFRTMCQNTLGGKVYNNTDFESAMKSYLIDKEQAMREMFGK